MNSILKLTCTCVQSMHVWVRLHKKPTQAGPTERAYNIVPLNQTPLACLSGEQITEKEETLQRLDLLVEPVCIIAFPISLLMNFSVSILTVCIINQIIPDVISLTS